MVRENRSAGAKCRCDVCETGQSGVYCCGYHSPPSTLLLSSSTRPSRRASALRSAVAIADAMPKAASCAGEPTLLLPVAPPWLLLLTLLLPRASAPPKVSPLALEVLITFAAVSWLALRLNPASELSEAGDSGAPGPRRVLTCWAAGSSKQNTALPSEMYLRDGTQRQPPCTGIVSAYAKHTHTGACTDNPTCAHSFCR